MALSTVSFDDLLDADSYGIQMDVSNTLFDIDNPLQCDVIQEASGKVRDTWQKKSPFHESDSGMSEDLGSIGSPDTPSEFKDNSGKMLDDLVESLDIEPFCSGSDKDLINYFGGKMSPDVEGAEISSTVEPVKLHSQTSSESDDSRSSSPEMFRSRTRSGHTRGVVGKTARSVPTSTHVSESVSSSDKVRSVKVLKVIKTSGTVDTATEVMRALDDRNKKNAVQAKINREKKKQYIKSLEDELSEMKSRNGKLEAENEVVVNKNAALEEEVQYLRAVLANESTLSRVLSNIENVQNVKLKSSFASRKRSAEMDHDYIPKKRSRPAVATDTAGVCLHVDNDTVSLEFCSKCSSMAKSADD